ncbi:MAG: hypothetical protein L3J67_08045 [Hyphomicrobiaceae bacterium]|nr:hypothetical protein [Hyphomicrobiaceae bacterium]
MTNHLPEIASRMLNTTLLLHPQKAEVLLWVLGPRIGISEQALQRYSAGYFLPENTSTKKWAEL